MPPRSTVEPEPAVTVPASVQVPERFSVPPLLASSVPELLQLVPLTEIVPPLTSASMVPWLIRGYELLPIMPAWPAMVMPEPMVSVPESPLPLL